MQQNSFFLPTLSSFLITLSVQGFDSNFQDFSSILLLDLTASSTFFPMWVLLNFFMRVLTLGPSFIMVQGLSGTAIGLLQAVPLAKYYVKITLFGSTPRSVYNIKYCPRTSNWGTLFPFNNLAGCHHIRLLCFLSHNQWLCLCNVFPALHVVQISFHLGQRSSAFQRHERPLLPQSNSSRICGALCLANWFMHFVLPPPGRQQTDSHSRGCADDFIDCINGGYRVCSCFMNFR